MCETLVETDKHLWANNAEGPGACPGRILIAVEIGREVESDQP